MNKTKLLSIIGRYTMPLLRNPVYRCIKTLSKNLSILHKNPSLQLKGWGGNILMDRCTFGKNITIYEKVILSNVEIGDFTYIASNTKISNCIIGNFCSIGPNCIIGLGKHPSQTFVSTHPIFYSTLKQSGISFVKQNTFQEYETITIGHDVWIGANCLIRDGVIIGNGCIIAAGSVVVKDIPDYSIVGGVPANLIRMRFSEQQIKKLQKAQWWNWKQDKIKQNLSKFHNINTFTN